MPIRTQCSSKGHAQNTHTRKNVNMQRRKGQRVTSAVHTSRRCVIHVSIKGNVRGVLQTITHFTSILTPSRHTRLYRSLPLTLKLSLSLPAAPPPSLPPSAPRPPTPQHTPSPGSTSAESLLAPCYQVSIVCGRWFAEVLFNSINFIFLLILFLSVFCLYSFTYNSLFVRLTESIQQFHFASTFIIPKYTLLHTLQIFIG